MLLLQTLAEFSSVAIRKAGIEVDAVPITIDAWRAVLPVKNHRLAFWDAMLWGAAERGRRAVADFDPFCLN
jgi:hypothetical protein